VTGGSTPSPPSPTAPISWNPPGAKLISAGSARDYAAIRAIGEASAGLQTKREALAARRQEQQRATDDLKAERTNVELALAFMVKAGGATGPVDRAPGQPGPVRAAGSLRPDPGGHRLHLPGPRAAHVHRHLGAPGWGRRHEGTDIMNRYGTDNVAVVSGLFETHHSGLGGLSIYLHGDDGNVYYYAHLSRSSGPIGGWPRVRSLADGQLGRCHDAPHPLRVPPGGGPP